MQDWDIVSVLSNLGVDFESEGSRNVRVLGESSIDEASENDLAFCWYTGQKGVSLITNSKAGVILCKTEMRSLAHPKSHQLLVFTNNPRLTFVRVVKEMKRKEQLVGISPRAVISEKSKIGSGCFIGDYAVIGDNCSLGDNTVIYDRVSLVQNCIVGKNCVIQSGASLGYDVFSFDRYEGCVFDKFPHKCYLRLGDNV